MTIQIYPEIYLRALVNMYRCTDRCIRINIHVDEIWKLMDMAVPYLERDQFTVRSTTNITEDLSRPGTVYCPINDKHYRGSCRPGTVYCPINDKHYRGSCRPGAVYCPTNDNWYIGRYAFASSGTPSADRWTQLCCATVSLPKSGTISIVHQSPPITMWMMNYYIIFAFLKHTGFAWWLTGLTVLPGNNIDSEYNIDNYILSTIAGRDAWIILVCPVSLINTIITVNVIDDMI